MESDGENHINVELTVQQIWEIVSSLDYVREEWGPTLPPDPLAEYLRNLAEKGECPQPCEHLSQQDARGGRVCSEHPCTCHGSSCGYSPYVLGGPDDERCIKPRGHDGAHLFPGPP